MNCTDCLGEQILSNCVNIAKNFSSFKATTLTEFVEEVDKKFPSIEDDFNGRNLIKNNSTQTEKNQFFLDSIEKIPTSENLLSIKIGIDLTGVNASLTKEFYTVGEILISMASEIKNLKTEIKNLQDSNVY